MIRLRDVEFSSNVETVCGFPPHFKVAMGFPPSKPDSESHLSFAQIHIFRIEISSFKLNLLF